jgi:hypothetical protein
MTGRIAWIVSVAEARAQREFASSGRFHLFLPLGLSPMRIDACDGRAATTAEKGHGDNRLYPFS